MPRRRLPQFRIAGLLGLMAIVAVVSSLIGAGAIFGVIWATIWFFPTVVGVFLALFSWRTRSQAGGVLTGIVGGLAGFGLVGCVLSMGAGIVFWLPLMLAWMPQYALALTYFDSPTGKALRPDDPLPDDWANELAARMEATAKGEAAQATGPKLNLVSERERPSSIVNFGWRFRKS